MRRVARGLARRLPSVIRVDDLHQEGLIALLLAARTSTRELSPAYITIRARGAMLDAVRRQYPRSVGNRVKRIERAVANLPPTATQAEIAAAAGLTVAEYHRTIAEFAVYREVEIRRHELVDDRDAGPASDPLAALIREHDEQVLADAIAALPDRERYAVVESYQKGRRLQDIASELGVKESRASQIRSAGVRRVRARVRKG